MKIKAQHTQNYGTQWKLRGKLIAPRASKKKLERAYTSIPTAHMKSRSQKEVNTPKKSRRQEIIKRRAEINQVETKRTRQRINKSSSWFFERINKIDEPLARLTREHRDSIQIYKIRNEKRDKTTETEEFKKKSSDPTTKAYTQSNWKIWMKWTIF